MFRFAWHALRWISAFNRVLLRRFTMAGRVALGGLVAAGVFGIDTERSTTYQAFTVLVAVLALGGLFALRLRPGVRVAREVPRTATAGLPFAYRLRLSNPTPRARAGLRVTDNLADPRPDLAGFLAAGAPPGARSPLARISGYLRWRWLVEQGANGRTREHAAVTVPAAGALDIVAELTPVRRGRVRFDSITLSRADPFGLVKACRDYISPDTVLVLPRRYRLPELVLPGARRHQPGGVSLAGSVGDSQEFLALREYRPGDPMQRVHWKSFARIGQPVVRDYQDEYFERHALALDTFVAPARAAVFEEAVSVAASFVCAVDTRECLLDLVFVGRRTHAFTAGRGMLRVERLLEALAGARAEPLGRFEDLSAAVLARPGALTSVILVLAGWDEPRRALAERLRGLGVAVLALVVVEDAERVSDAAPWLRVLRAGRIQEDLARGFA